MINWNMVTPRRLISGRGSIEYLPRLLKEMRLHKPFLVLDPEVEKSSFGSKVMTLLGSMEKQAFNNFSTNPTFVHVRGGVACFSGADHDCIIAIGGGSAIDLAKVVGLVVANGGRAEDYFQGTRPQKRSIPTIAIPTTCGTGAEGSPFAVIMDTSIPKKKGMESLSLMPYAVILDPDSLSSLSKTMIAATGMDTFAHILESHLSTKATTLTRITSRGLLYSIREAMEKAMFEKESSALETLQCLAFTARLLYPRTGLSIAHALSHPLGAYTNIHHGLAVIFFLEASLTYNLPACEGSARDAEIAMGLANSGMSLNSWISFVTKESGINDLIVKALQGFSLPIEAIAIDSLKSSNIISNPRDLRVENVHQIIKDSINRFGGGQT